MIDQEVLEQDVWTHAEMRDAVQDVRRVRREMVLNGSSYGGPTDVVLAHMLEQVLDEAQQQQES
jgi:hypothetical protein